MACYNCVKPERKWCEEYGLPAPEQTECWVTGISLKETKPTKGDNQ